MPPVDTKASGKLATKISSDVVLKEVRKRGGRVVPFDASRIISAISRAMEAVGEGNLRNDPYRVAEAVIKELRKKYTKGGTPGIEDIQDIVETQLILMDFPRVAKAYILYRHKRSEIRDARKKVPAALKKFVRDSKKYFRNPLSEFVYYRSYSRWIEEENRRETWIETVDRYMNFM